MTKKIPGVPNLTMPTVDVRDVAEAHYQAFVRPGINGERFIINQESVVFTEIADALHNEFNQYGYRVQTRRIGYCPLKIASWFDGQVKIVLNFINTEIYAHNDKSKEILGVTYERNLKTSMIEMGNSLIDRGLLPELRNKKQ